MDRLVAKLLFAIVALLIVPAANGQTDLIVAASRGDVATVNALLARGVDPNQADERTGLTPLTQSSFYGHVEVVRLLLRAGADLNRASKDGLTALTQACVKGQIEVLDFLLSKGADVNSRSVTSFTPLMWTAAVGQTNRKTVTARLIAAGANVDARDERGRTALMLVPFDQSTAQIQEMLGFKDDDLAVTKLLIGARANIDAVDSSGTNALGYAEKKGRTKVAALLRISGARLPR